MACSVEGCKSETRLRKGLCGAHYMRLRKHGDPLISKRATNGAPMAWVKAHLDYAGDDCLRWPFGEYVRGYGQMSFRGRPQYAHRVICELVHGEPPQERGFALHRCGKGHEGCVNPRHLYWGTLSENAMDAIRHGALPYGEDHPFAVLTEEQVREIIRLRGVETQARLAARFGVNQQHISLIQRGKRWGHVHRKIQIAFGEAA